MKRLTFILFICLIANAVSLAQTGNKSKSAFSLCIAGKSGGNITRKELLTDSTIHFCNDSLSGGIEITGFRASFIHKGKPPALDVYSDGNRISERQKGNLSECHAGDKVFFEYIKGRSRAGTDRSERSFEPLSFTIVSE